MTSMISILGRGSSFLFAVLLAMGPQGVQAGDATCPNFEGKFLATIEGQEDALLMSVRPEKCGFVFVDSWKVDKEGKQTLQCMQTFIVDDVKRKLAEDSEAAFKYTSKTLEEDGSAKIEGVKLTIESTFSLTAENHLQIKIVAKKMGIPVKKITIVATRQKESAQSLDMSQNSTEGDLELLSVLPGLSSLSHNCK